jgi:benzoyl-CoA reductase subunit C
LNTSLNSNAFKALSDVSGVILNNEIIKWKEDGGKVVGYFCSSFPEELLTAGGLLPFRMRATGSTGTELADAYFSSINCSFPRHCFNEALKGSYSFLDGLVVYNSCDSTRRIYDHWKDKLDTPFVQFLSMPRKAEQPQVDWCRDEFDNLKKSIEDHFKVAITDEKISDAVKVHNETRQLLRQLYEFKKQDNPKISGAETLAIVVAGTAMSKTKYNSLLKDLIKDIENAPANSNDGARIMVIGGELDNPGYLEIIENQGCQVVTDSLCFGTRNFWKDIDESESDPLYALAKYYIMDRPSCPRVYGLYEKRSAHVKEMIEEFNVEAVILEKLNFCDPWGFEQFTIKNTFDDWDIPLLMLDRDYTLSGTGQLKTRIQAFLESTGGK